MHASTVLMQGKHSCAQFRNSVANRSAVRLVTTHVVAFLQPLTEAISPEQNEAEGHDQSFFLVTTSMWLLALSLAMGPDLVEEASTMLMPRESRLEVESMIEIID